VNRSDKSQTIERMHEAFAAAPNVVLTGFSGLTANQSNELRARIRKAGGRYVVLKNRLAKRAAVGTPMERLADRLRGPCAAASHASDPVILAKTLTDFAKDNPALELLAAVVEAREVVDGAGVKKLATLPGIAELRAQLLAMIQTPAANLVRMVQTPGLTLARVIDARAAQGGES
jgi:large subunit ribosomal protein L10